MGSSRSAASCRSPRRRTSGGRPSRRDPDEAIGARDPRRGAEGHHSAHLARARPGVRRPQGLEADGPRRPPRSALPRAAADARAGAASASCADGRGPRRRSRMPAAERPADLVDRHFTATRPNQLWVVGFHLRRHVERLRLRRLRDRRLRAPHRRLARRRRRCAPTSCSMRSSRRSTPAVTTRSATSCTTAIAAASICRCATPSGWPTPASSRRSAAVAIRYDNALAESVIGLFKAEVIRRKGPWRTLEAVEFATLDVGGLVQSSTAARADRLRAAGRVRGALL